MTKAIAFSRRNDAGSRARTKEYQENLVLVVVLVLESKGDVMRHDSQRLFLAQYSLAMLEQCCSHSKQCRNNVETLSCAKNRGCESSRVISP